MPEHTPLTDGRIDELVARVGAIGELAREVRAARRLLRAVEWDGGESEVGDETCPWCVSIKDDGHADDCDLGHYLAACEGKAQP